MQHMQYDVAFYQWFCARRAQNHPVSARQLSDEAQRIASVDGRMLSRFFPYLQARLQTVGGGCIVILDSASAHILQAVLHAMRRCGLRYVVIPGGLTMFIQSIDTPLAALYHVAHHKLYVSHMEHEGKLTAAQQRDLFVEFCYGG